ncbi:MAG: nitroreductase family protein [Methyloceanibacter sp.]|uniref:nitroreductase family protein n=1 Tax=Methyloceanibacter sp. TaxID=1965321 RepID=UPI003D6CF0D6
MELLRAIDGRRSVREYTDAPVDDEVLRELIEAAVKAPSAINQQPWSFIVIKDKARLASMSDQAKAYFLKASLGAPAHRDMLNDPAFHIFYHAPVLVVIAAAEPTDWAVEDCALAAENLMLAAYAKGLGTCWIGFAQHWLATADGKAALGLLATYAPIAPIVVGHPRREPPPVPRKTPEIRWINQAGPAA